MGVLAPIPLGGALVCLSAWVLWDAPGGGAFSLDCFALATLSFLVFLVLLGSVCVCLLLFFLRGLFSKARSFLSCIGGFPVRSPGADFGLDTMV